MTMDRTLERLPDNPFNTHPPTPRLLTRHDDQFARMAQWLDLFMRTAEVAKVLARTNFVPDAMRGQPEDIAAAMMRGLELGVDPLDALANLHVIKGRVGYSAEFMRRRILEAGHEIVIDEATDSRCKIRGRRAGSTEWQTAVFTAEQASKARIHLGDYPADKLVARASSRLCRRVFPDVLAGAVILDEVIDVDGETITDEPPSGSRRGVQRKRQPRKIEPQPTQQPPQPDPIDELLDEPPTAVEPEPQPQEDPTRLTNRMFVLFGKADIDKNNREDRLIVTRAILKMPNLKSSNDLDKIPGAKQKLVDQLGEWERKDILGQKVTDILNEHALREAEEG
jgi:hypothetical protein